MDIENISDEELDRMQAALQREKGRRALREQSALTIEDVLRNYHEASPETAPEPGAQWQPPATVLEAYPQGISAVNGGTLYENTVPNNLREPGTPDCGWVDIGSAEAGQLDHDTGGQDD